MRNKVIKRQSYFFSFFVYVFLFFISSFIFIFFTSPALANHLPKPSGYVNDFAGVLTTDQKNNLENNLSNYAKQTGNEISVAFVKNLNGGNIDDFTVKAFEEWKIGKKGKDNGILFLATIEERKMRIEIGYGLEPYLTDSQAGSIIRDIIAPKFQQNDYYGGTLAGISAIENKIGNKQSNPNIVQVIKKIPVVGNIFQILINAFALPYLVIFLFGIPVYLFSYMSRTKSIWAGGIAGAVIGLIGGYFFNNLIEQSITVAITTILGFLLDWQLSKNYQANKRRGRSTDWWTTGGGFWGGGIGGSGGGFGGFGGGSSGGGGSSDSW